MATYTADDVLRELHAEFRDALQRIAVVAHDGDKLASALNDLRCQLLEKTEMDPDDVSSAIDVVALELVGLFDPSLPERAISPQEWQRVEDGFVDSVYELAVRRRLSPGASENRAATTEGQLHGTELLLERVALEEPVSMAVVDTPVWFTTDRRWDGNRFIDEREDHSCRRSGIGTVATVKYHSVGDEGVTSTVKSASPRLEDDFWSGLQSGADTQRQLLVYVHGYGVSFESALVGAAHLSLDLSLAPIVVYAWTTMGNWIRDRVDLNTTIDGLVVWLERLVEYCGGVPIHLLAHSLGCELLVEALARLSPGTEQSFGELVLSAADLSPERFRNLLPRIRPAVRGITTYASRCDLALWAAWWLTSGADRLGLYPPAFQDERVDTILVRSPGRWPYHSYHAECPAVLYDLRQLLVKGFRPERRALWRHHSSWLLKGLQTPVRTVESAVEGVG